MVTLLFTMITTFDTALADKNSKLDVLDKYLEEQCINYNWDFKNEKWVEFHKWYTSVERCILIWKGQLRFETNWCKIWNGEKNNCFGFRWGVSLKWEKEFNMKYDWTGSYSFKTDKDSIRFYVDRFYRVDLYKTVEQIVKWGSYISPRSWKRVTFGGFARTDEVTYANYITSVKKYVSENRHNIWKLVAKVKPKKTELLAMKK